MLWARAEPSSEPAKRSDETSISRLLDACASLADLLKVRSVITALLRMRTIGTFGGQGVKANSMPLARSWRDGGLGIKAESTRPRFRRARVKLFREGARHKLFD